MTGEHRPPGPTRHTPAPGAVTLTGGFWGAMTELNRGPALAHQWEWLEATGAIDNLRVAAGRIAGTHHGPPFSDSDVYKWMEAASLAVAATDDAALVARRAEAIELVEAAQEPSGYLGTFRQLGPSPARFVNLEVEHELYCLGHLIEAGVTDAAATGEDRLLAVARRAADCIADALWDAPAHRVDGHPEVELALIRLSRHTGEDRPREMALRLLERRGHDPHRRRHLVASLARSLGGQLAESGRRRRARRVDPDLREPRRPPAHRYPVPRKALARMVRDAWTGRYFQTDEPAAERVEPTGHAVRYLYLQRALAMLARDGALPVPASLTGAWDRLVEAHLFASGGAGALSVCEGFGDPFDLDPHVAYAETCAAIASVHLSRELGLLTGEACYDDLAEWQLLNAVDVGLGADGRSYTYDNPLVTDQRRDRQAWFSIPCCPSNLSRTWLALGTHQLSWTDDELTVHQLFASRATLPMGTVRVESELPWEGAVRIEVPGGESAPRRVRVRIPSWSDAPQVWLDGSPVEVEDAPPPRPTAFGLHPHRSRWATVRLPEGSGGEIRVELDLPLRLLQVDPRVPVARGQVSIARGPLLYCLEATDDDPLTGIVVAPNSLRACHDDDATTPVVVEGLTVDGRPLRFIPYASWGNRGPATMTTLVGLPPPK